MVCGDRWLREEKQRFCKWRGVHASTPLDALFVDLKKTPTLFAVLRAMGLSDVLISLLEVPQPPLHHRAGVNERERVHTTPFPFPSPPSVCAHGVFHATRAPAQPNHGGQDISTSARQGTAFSSPFIAPSSRWALRASHQLPSDQSTAPCAPHTCSSHTHAVSSHEPHWPGDPRHWK